MASVISHAVAAVALGRMYAAKAMPLRFWVLSIVCSIVPDADVIGFTFGISYGEIFGHRGFTHSLLFAFILSCIIVLLAFKEASLFSKERWSLVLYFFLVTASHGFLDGLTNGGLGVAFFSPFDTTRHFFPWRPIEVSPIGIDSFFSSRGVEVLSSEIVWIWIPSALLVIGVWLYRRLLKS